MSISRIVVEPTASYVDLFEALSPHNRLDEIEYRLDRSHVNNADAMHISRRIADIMEGWDTHKTIYFPECASTIVLSVARAIRVDKSVATLEFYEKLASAPFLEELTLNASNRLAEIRSAVAQNPRITKLTLRGKVGLAAFALGPPAPHVKHLTIDGGPTSSADLRPHLQTLDMPALDANLLDFLDKARMLERLVLRECSGLHLDVVRAWYRSTPSSLRVVCFETTGLMCDSIERIWTVREFKLNIVIALTRTRCDGDLVLARRIAEFA
jgi:hypothetical protein